MKKLSGNEGIKVEVTKRRRRKKEKKYISPEQKICLQSITCMEEKCVWNHKSAVCSVQCSAVQCSAVLRLDFRELNCKVNFFLHFFSSLSKSNNVVSSVILFIKYSFVLSHSLENTGWSSSIYLSIHDALFGLRNLVAWRIFLNTENIACYFFFRLYVFIY